MVSPWLAVSLSMLLVSSKLSVLYRWVCFEGWDWFVLRDHVRVTTAFAKNISDDLVVTRGLWLVIYQKIPIRLFGFFRVSGHECCTIFIKHSFCNDANLFPVTRTSEKNHVFCISANVCVKFPFGKHILQQKDDTRIMVPSLREQ